MAQSRLSLFPQYNWLIDYCPRFSVPTVVTSLEELWGAAAGDRGGFGDAGGRIAGHAHGGG